MLVLRRTPQRRRRSPIAAGAICAALLLTSAGCSSEAAPARPSAKPTTQSTSLADYDTSDLTLARAGFCGRVAADAIAAAVGSADSDEQTDEQSWRPGARLPGSRVISNEFGCSWSSGPASATAWVFAPPITSERAADFVGEVVAQGCRPLRRAPDLGEPSVGQRCSHAGGRTAIHGLVGDTWVGCEISGRAGSQVDDTDLVGDWCVAVLEALRSA